ncbi:putative MobA-like protein [Sphaerochaeta pleomorpha str. Grapes]|uniref:Putative MobA-like protein n=1 Tax=Sphaerochaeta pleomorpha (strain ATCC BAA-1885 / DSM 22778 / Grapes) TaxID=158190 RepID=G8QQU4_SPHPG|nr:nucleotidyltransferase family protein [Sphaerochaeta pleomorpha]AEV28725.1 putative MobA-like protein [Sphaerochaeta pleomorpha str. Grapes]
MHKPPLIKGIILAAGLSSRMGECKPLMPVRGKTMIENSIDSMLESGVDSVIVVLGYQGKKIERMLEKRYQSSVAIVYNNDFKTTDMLHSIQIGVQSLGDCDAFFVLPADMPDIHSSTFQSLMECWVATSCLVAFPCLDKKRKHPPLIDIRCRDTILFFKGQGGLRSVWHYFEDNIATVSVEDMGCDTDLDTRKDYCSYIEKYTPGKPAKQEVGTYGYQ